jgi:hypothetical protein
MRSLTFLSENRISGLEKFWSAVDNDFFNSIGHGRKTNHVRGDGSFPQERSPDAGDGCTAYPLTTGFAIGGGT